MSANAFNLVMSKMLSFGKGLRHTLNLALEVEFVFDRVEILLGKKIDMLMTSIFSFSHLFFQKASFFGFGSMREVVLLGKKMIYSWSGSQQESYR